VRRPAPCALGARQRLHEQAAAGWDEGHRIPEEAAAARVGRAAERRHRALLWRRQGAQVRRDLRQGLAETDPARKGPRPAEEGIRRPHPGRARGRPRRRAAPALVIPVLIVGGGPVGLALAIELGSRGVACTLIEQGDGRIVDAKMFATGIRTLEFCRRWGIAGQVRDWGFPREFPFDNVFVTSLAGYELARIPVPSIARTPPLEQSPENFAHCPQFVFDRILAEKARNLPQVELRYGKKLLSFRQIPGGVEATLEGGETLKARYLAGCDGYASTVRRQLGIEMEGDENLNRAVNIMFRTRALASLHDKGDAGRYVIIGAEGP